MRKIPVLRLNFPCLSAREIFHKYPSQTLYICSKSRISFIFTVARVFAWGFNFFSLCRGICENVFNFFTLACLKPPNSFGIFLLCLYAQGNVINQIWNPEVFRCKRKTAKKCQTTTKSIIYLASVLNNIRCNYTDISYWERYLRKIPVLRLNFPRLSDREIFRLSTGIFRKYPSQTWYICSLLITWRHRYTIVVYWRKI